MKFFKHDPNIRETDALWEIIETHGLAGYGFYWAIIEELYKAESTGFMIHATQRWQRRIKKDLNIANLNTIITFLDLFAECGAIDSQLWKEGYICIPEIISEGDRYTKAKAKEAEKNVMKETKKIKVSYRTPSRLL